MALVHVICVHLAILVSAACAHSWACSSGLLSVRTFVEVETSKEVDSDFVHVVAEWLWNASMVKQQETPMGYKVMGNVHVFNVDSRRLQIQKTQNSLQIEVSTCNAAWGPAKSYQLASYVQRVVGGGTWNWSVAISPPPIDANLNEFFSRMATSSDHKILIASSSTNFSSAEIWRINGATTLLLNNVVMSDTRDEALYHEMLVHPALLAATSPQRVLIIGGGEGASLREVLRNRHVKNATMVDMDEALVAMCRAHLPMMHQGSFSSPKATVIFQDGVHHLQHVPPGTYDVIIVDGIDVSEAYDEDTCVAVDTCDSSACKDRSCTSYGDVLFTAEFYTSAHQALRHGGVFAQYISAVEEDDCKDRLSKAGFNESIIYSVPIESFHGQGARFALAAKDLEDLITDRVVRALTQSDVGFQHLNYTSFHESLGSERNWRRLKTSAGSSGSGGGGGKARLAWWHVLLIVVGVCAFLGMIVAAYQMQAESEGQQE